MRRFVVLLAAATLSACAGSAPVAEVPPALPPAPRPAVVLPPAPEPPADPVVVPEPEPAPPPAAPRGTVLTRAYYAEADVTEWVLTGGATVVFKPLPTDGVVLRLAFWRPDDAPASDAAEWTETDGGSPDQLERLFRNLRRAPDRAPVTFVVVGDAQPGEVEAAAAQALVLRPGLVPREWVSSPRMRLPRAVFRVTAPPESDATFAVLVHLLKARSRTTRVRAQRDERSGTTALGGDIESDALRTLRPTADEVAAARRMAVERTPDAWAEARFWAEALADLYRTDGPVRPSRDPAFVARFPSRVARVSSQAVADLAARLASAPDTSSTFFNGFYE